MIDLLFIQGETAETTVAVQTEAPAVRQAEVIEVESKNANAKDMQQTPPGGGWSFWVMIIPYDRRSVAVHVASRIEAPQGYGQVPRGLEEGRQDHHRRRYLRHRERGQGEASLLIEVDSNVTLRIDKNMVVGDPSQAQQPAK